MPIVQLYGHEALRARLGGAARSGTLPASLLLHGARGAGKQRLALWLGQLLLCEAGRDEPCGACGSCRYSAELIHPDLHWFFPRPRLKDTDPSLADVREDYAEAVAQRVAEHGLYPAPSGSAGIYVGTVRAIVAIAALKPALASRKIFVIGDAERMVPQEGADQAANAFLKLLEEPPANTTIVLTSSEPGALLATIRSRVVALRVSPLPQATVRGWLADPLVAEALRTASLPAAVERRLELASGAPGALLGIQDAQAGLDAARRLLEAATGDAAGRYRSAYAQGATRARGAFATTLDALSVLLHERTRLEVERRDDERAVRAARAMEAVERAKMHAQGNVNPQLVSAALLRELASALR